VAYGADKYQARRGGRRIRERTLHLLELLGGWPGAMVGQAVFRHKRRKRKYVLVLMAIIILHVGIWIGLAFGVIGPAKS
jgi:uncharacterized membrane protein YsdA (DUF1294 family)